MAKKKSVKSYAQKITQKNRKVLLELVSDATNHHDRFKHAYVFEPPSGASKRKRYEENNSFAVEFDYDGHLYLYDCDVTCSCKHVYYYHCFKIDNHTVNVAPFRKVQRELTEAIEAYDLKHSNKEQ